MVVPWRRSEAGEGIEGKCLGLFHSRDMLADNYHHVGSKLIGFISLVFTAQEGKPTLLTRNKASGGRSRQQKRKPIESRPTDPETCALNILCPVRAW